MKLDVKAFAIASGIMVGFGVFLYTWWIIGLEGPTGEITFLGRVYRGYSISPLGSFAGLLWGLADGLIAGAVFAWLYNFVVSRLSDSS